MALRWGQKVLLTCYFPVHPYSENGRADVTANSGCDYACKIVSDEDAGNDEADNNVEELEDEHGV
jgi:hypothetical protein